MVSWQKTKYAGGKVDWTSHEFAQTWAAVGLSYSDESLLAFQRRKMMSVVLLIIFVLSLLI